MKDFPLDHEKFCEIRDQLLLNNNYKALDL